MPKNIDNNAPVIQWADAHERGVFDALSDSLRLNPNLPGALGHAIYQDNLIQLISVATVSYELYPPDNHMRQYLEGYISEVESILREGNF